MSAAFSAASIIDCPYNIPMPIPSVILGQKYISLTTFRKSGVAVPTPVWFGEEDDKLYVMTRSDSGKYKRIRNNPQVQIAPCTVRGKITGPEFDAKARILPPEDWPRARKTIAKKYWLARIPFFWSKKNVYVEIDGLTSHS
jgi:PPOX class probable F420-dependent enzyme